MTQRPEKTRIKVWCAQHGKTQQWLATKLRISESHFTRILDGTRTPSVDTAKKLYDLTGVKLPDAADVAALAS